jgi:hypothetical protein
MAGKAGKLEVGGSGARDLEPGERTPYMIVGGVPPGKTSMSRNPAFVLFVALALIAPTTAFAQLTPPAGSAGAGNSSISGVPFGPANPRALSDPSGIGNAANIPPLRPNPPPPPVSYGSVDQPARARLVTPPYAGASQRIISPRQARQQKPPVRRRTRPEVSSFTGICRGC